MAVKTIAELPLITTIADNDLLVIDDGSRNYSIKWGVLKNLITGISSFTADNTAGTISITLSTGAVLTITPHDPTKQDVLTFDATPTAGSTKPVTSGGIKTALDLKLDSSDYVNFTGATSDNAGTAGKVPAPAAGGARYLGSEGAWLTPDSVPTNGSTLLITSDAVYDALLLIATDIAPVYNPEATYALGAYCTHDNTLYKCTTAITTAEAWTAGHWTAVSVGAVLASLESAVATNASDIDAIEGTLEDIDEELDKVVHVTAQAFTDAQKAQARKNIDAMSQSEFGHKRFGVSGVGQSSPTLTRLYDAVGMTATPGTDTVQAHSDFDAYAPFNRRKCVGYWTAGNGKAVFHVNAYEGDADYVEDGTKGDYVAVEVEPFYYYDQDGILAVSSFQYAGYKIHPVCCDYDGNIRQKTYLPVYALALDGNNKAVSLPGLMNQRGSYNDLRNYAASYNASDISSFAMIEPMAVWHYEWLLMTIEFATTNMQSVMFGCGSLPVSGNHKIYSVPAANTVIVNAVITMVPGQTIYIGAGVWDSTNVLTTYNIVTSCTRCDASGNASSSGAYTKIVYSGTDRSSSITPGTTTISSRPWRTGVTNGAISGIGAVKGHTGSPISNSNGYYPMRYRWRENVYGNQYHTTLDLADLRVEDGSSYHLDWYFLNDPRKYTPFGNYDKATIQNADKGWVKLRTVTPVASYSNGYIKQLDADSRFPWVRVPVLTTGGSSATYYCDYAYLVSSHEVRSVRWGGNVADGASDGPCYFSAYYAPSYAYWSYGAALYFLLASFAIWLSARQSWMKLLSWPAWMPFCRSPSGASNWKSRNSMVPLVKVAW